MAAIKWDQIGEKRYEIGVDHGVLYPQKNGAYPKGVGWSGLTNVTESPSGAEATKLYADNIPYLVLHSAEEYGLTIEAYYYPDEWEACNGESDLVPGVKLGQQRRNTFGFSYRSKLGNDTDGEDHGYKLHMVYGCSSAPSEKTHESVNDSPDAGTFSFEVTTVPVNVSGKDSDGNDFKPTSCVTIDSTKIEASKLAALEKILYGSDEGDGTDARLPLPDELATILAAG